MLFLIEIPPPKDLQLFDANLKYLRVNWTPPVFNCSDVNYIITGTNNCGICTNTTDNTSATCTDMYIDGHLCNMTIQAQSETCDLLGGALSRPLHILLKGIILLLYINSALTHVMAYMQCGLVNNWCLCFEVQ